MTACVLIVLLLFELLSSVLGAGNATYFADTAGISGKVCPSSDVVTSILAPSLISCVYYCSKSGACQGVFYNEVDLSCIGCQGNYDDSSGLEDKPGTLYFSKRNCKGPLPSAPNVIVSQFTGDRNIGASFPYTCDPACTYFPVPENSMIICKDDGTWSTPECWGIDAGFFSNGDLIPSGAKGCASTFGSGNCGGSVTDGYFLNGEIGDCNCHSTCCDWGDCCFDASCDDYYYQSYSYDSTSSNPTYSYDSTSSNPTYSYDSTSLNPTYSYDSTSSDLTHSYDSTSLNPTYSYDSTSLNPTYSYDSTSSNPTYSYDSNSLNPTYSYDSTSSNPTYSYDSYYLDPSYASYSYSSDSYSYSSDSDSYDSYSYDSYSYDSYSYDSYSYDSYSYSSDSYSYSSYSSDSYSYDSYSYDSY